MGMSRLYRTPPGSALNVKFLFTEVPGLFSFSERHASEVPVELEELRSQALVGYNRQDHTKREHPWITERVMNRLFGRADGIWDLLPARGDLREDLREELCTCEAMVDTRPRLLRTARNMNAGSFVYGLLTLFHVYAESQYWRDVDLINALAGWWGVTPRAIIKRMEGDGFFCAGGENRC